VIFFRTQNVKKWLYVFAPAKKTIDEVYRELTEDDSGDRLW